MARSRACDRGSGTNHESVIRGRGTRTTSLARDHRLRPSHYERVAPRSRGARAVAAPGPWPAMRNCNRDVPTHQLRERVLNGFLDHAMKNGSLTDAVARQRACSALSHRTARRLRRWPRRHPTPRRCRAIFCPASNARRRCPTPNLGTRCEHVMRVGEPSGHCSPGRGVRRSISGRALSHLWSAFWPAFVIIMRMTSIVLPPAFMLSRFAAARIVA